MIFTNPKVNPSDEDYTDIVKKNAKICASLFLEMEKDIKKMNYILSYFEMLLFLESWEFELFCAILKIDSWRYKKALLKALPKHPEKLKGTSNFRLEYWLTKWFDSYNPREIIRQGAPRCTNYQKKYDLTYNEVLAIIELAKKEENKCIKNTI